MNYQLLLRVLALGAALTMFANATNVNIEPQLPGSAVQATQWREFAEFGRRGS